MWPSSSTHTPPGPQGGSCQGDETASQSRTHSLQASAGRGAPTACRGGSACGSCTTGALVIRASSALGRCAAELAAMRAGSAGGSRAGTAGSCRALPCGGGWRRGN